jgi:hypothetical protein
VRLGFRQWQTRAFWRKQALEIVGEAAYCIGIYCERPDLVVAVAVNDEIADT